MSETIPTKTIALRHLEKFLNRYEAEKIDLQKFNQSFHEYVYLTYGVNITKGQCHDLFDVLPDDELLEIYRTKLRKIGEKFEKKLANKIARKKIKIEIPKYDLQLRAFEKAYIAGIVDGEGCIFLGTTKNRIETRNKSYNCSLRVEMACRAVPQYLLDKCGGTLTTRSKLPPRRRTWTWSVSDQHAEDVMREIYPYLVEKKKEAEVFLKLREAKKRQRYALHKKLTEEEMNYRNNLIKELRKSRKQYDEGI